MVSLTRHNKASQRNILCKQLSWFNLTDVRLCCNATLILNNALQRSQRSLTYFLKK